MPVWSCGLTTITEKTFTNKEVAVDFGLSPLNAEHRDVTTLTGRRNFRIKQLSAIDDRTPVNGALIRETWAMTATP